MKNRALFLLSGEPSTIPLAEAKALFLAGDPTTTFERIEGTLFEAHTSADPFAVGSRIAFARRVGAEVEGPREAGPLLSGRKVRVRTFDLVPGLHPASEGAFLDGIDVEVDLKSPELELTVLRGKEVRYAVTKPTAMRQGWSLRRPRKRAFFHPAAIFPKLSRALVNLSRCERGGTFFDPFCGTGSLAMEAAMVGSAPLVSDVSDKMTRGALANMKQLRQEWLGVLRADAFHLPLRRVGAIATDVPYGRAASTGGRARDDLLANALDVLPEVLAVGSRLVVMHSEESRVESTSDLELEEEHTLYVHKLLTRVISVFRRR